MTKPKSQKILALAFVVCFGIFSNSCCRQPVPKPSNGQQELKAEFLGRGVPGSDELCYAFFQSGPVVYRTQAQWDSLHCKSVAPSIDFTKHNVVLTIGNYPEDPSLTTLGTFVYINHDLKEVEISEKTWRCSRTQDMSRGGGYTYRKLIRLPIIPKGYTVIHTQD
jgi:hypothetical protein